MGILLTTDTHRTVMAAGHARNSSESMSGLQIRWT